MTARLAGALAVCWTALVFANYHSGSSFPPFEVVRALWPVGMARESVPAAWVAHLTHALVALAVLLAARGMGRFVRRLLPGTCGIPLLSPALGLLVVGQAVLGLGLAGLLRAPTLLAVALVGVTLGGVPPLRVPRGLPRSLWVLAASAGLVALWGALVPEVTYDALAYHLGAPGEFLKAGRVVRLDHMFFTDFPLGLQSVYALALGLGGGAESAKLVHWALGLMCLAAAFRLGRRVGGTAVGAWAGAFFMGAALVATQMAKANVDLGAAFLVSAGLLALLESRGAGGLVAAGTLLGGAVSVKLTGGLAVIGAVAVVLSGLAFPSPLLGRGGFGGEGLHANRKMGAMFFLLVGCLLPMASWLFRAWLTTGNPVYPFLWQWLGGLGWGAENAAAYRFDMTGPTSFNIQYALPASRLAGPWLAALHERASGAGFGPFALALAPLLVLSWQRLGSPARATAVFAGAFWLAWFFAARDTRFLLPALPAFAALSALGLAGLSGVPGGIVRLSCVLAIAFVPLQAAHFSWRSLNPATVVWGAVPPGIYQERLVPPPGFVDLARRAGEEAPGGRVLVVGDVKGTGAAPRAVYQSMFDTPHLSAAVRESASAGRLAARLRQGGIASVIYNRGGAIYLRGQFGHYKWTGREQRVLADFMGRWLAPVRAMKEGNELSMGLYRVLAKPGVFRKLPIPGE